MNVKRKQAYRPPVTEDEQLWLFSVAIRHPGVFAEARPRLREEHFGQTEQWLYLIWRVVREHFAAFGKLPSHRMISVRCSAELKLNPSCIPDGHEQHINKFLNLAFRLE
jgi:hypothetical protein